MERKEKKISIFVKVFFWALLIIILSNAILSYTVYLGYEGVLSQIRPILSIEQFKNLEVNIYNTWLIVAIFFIFAILVTILFVVFFTSGIIRPLQQLLAAMSEIKKGNLEVRAEIESKDEIEQLANEFNLMVRQLKEAGRVLEEEKMSLEIRVRARTKELEELTKSLEKQVKERTAELENKVRELEKFHHLTVGRELKMIELKKKLKELEEKKKG
jgi:nitrogen fixation/metabolism regulation signal transduction histidine kinase